jgi:hypothetical protein
MKAWLLVLSLCLAACGEAEDELVDDVELGSIHQALTTSPLLLEANLAAPSGWYASQVTQWRRDAYATANPATYYPSNWAGGYSGGMTGAIKRSYPAGHTCQLSGTDGFWCTWVGGSYSVQCPYGVHPNVRRTYRMTDGSASITWGGSQWPITYSQGVAPMTNGRIVDTFARTMQCSYLWSVNITGHYLRISNP